jgi:hypothetical protein
MEKMKKDISASSYLYIRIIMNLLPPACIFAFGTYFSIYIIGPVISYTNNIDIYSAVFRAIAFQYFGAVVFCIIGYYIHRYAITEVISLIHEKLENNELFTRKSIFLNAFQNPVKITRMSKSFRRSFYMRLTLLAIIACLFGAIFFIGIRNDDFELVLFSSSGFVGYGCGFVLSIEIIPYLKVIKELNK